MTLKQGIERQVKDGAIIIQKDRGETPLESLSRYRLLHPGLAKEKMTYVGRLDPLAHGELLVLIGEECKKREEYLGLDKVYKVKLLLGVQTDTFDCLGLIVKSSVVNIKDIKEIIENKLKNLVGKWLQKYPWFSSRTVQGKSLFDWFKSGRQSEIERPSREVEINKLEIINWSEKKSTEIYQEVVGVINKVSGDFRQKETLKLWQEWLEQNQNTPLPIIEIRVHCSTGSYMRGIAEKLSEDLDLPILAWEIEREKVLI